MKPVRLPKAARHQQLRNLYSAGFESLLTWQMLPRALPNAKSMQGVGDQHEREDDAKYDCPRLRKRLPR
jgi:hypothetical protein